MDMMISRGPTAPDIPTDEIARVHRMDDAEGKVKALAEKAYAAENAHALADASKIDIVRAQAVLAERDLNAARRKRDSTSPGVIHRVKARAMSPDAIVKLAILYVATGLSWSSTVWMTSNWVVAADLFEGVTFPSALLLVGIVITTGVWLPLVAYNHCATDRDRQRFHRMSILIGVTCGLTWAVSFASVEWAQLQVDHITIYGTKGAVLSMTQLGNINSFGRTVMLLTGIAAECSASVALEIAVIRFVALFGDVSLAPSPYYLMLEKAASEAEADLKALHNEIAALDALEVGLEAGRIAFIDACVGWHRHFIEMLGTQEFKVSNEYIDKVMKGL